MVREQLRRPRLSRTRRSTTCASTRRTPCACTSACVTRLTLLRRRVSSPARLVCSRCHRLVRLDLRACSRERRAARRTLISPVHSSTPRSACERFDSHAEPASWRSPPRRPSTCGAGPMPFAMAGLGPSSPRTRGPAMPSCASISCHQLREIHMRCHHRRWRLLVRSPLPTRPPAPGAPAANPAPAARRASDRRQHN